MIRVPNLIAPLVSRMGLCLQPWTAFFQQFSQPPSAMLTLTVGASPFAYQVLEPGNIFITGGSVSLVQLTRGSDTITLQAGVLIPVSIGDIITTTYTVLPTIRFLPNYATPRGA